MTTISAHLAIGRNHEVCRYWIEIRPDATIIRMAWTGRKPRAFRKKYPPITVIPDDAATFQNDFARHVQRVLRRPVEYVMFFPIPKD